MTLYTFANEPPPAHIVTGRIRRVQCPVHGGKNLSVAVGYTDGRAWAKCWSRGCASKDILAALNLTPSTTSRTSSTTSRTSTTTTPLTPITPAQGRAYLEGIRTPHGAQLQYQRQDGKRGWHKRWQTSSGSERRVPGITGDGWQARRFNPLDPSVANAIVLCEGEKDAAILAQAGLIAFSAPRGWGGLKTADFTELVQLAKETELPVVLAGDNDTVGHKAMLRVRELLREQGLHPIDTASHAPHKGSIADLPAHELLGLVHLLVEYDNSSWLKPLRTSKKYESFRCPHPKRWQGLPGDRQTVKNFRSCGNTATCRQCDEWEAFLHVERAIRGNPQQMVVVSGFGGADSTIAETVRMAKTFRERQLDRLRKFSVIGQKTENPSSQSRKYLTVIRIGDDYRASFALILRHPMTLMELDRERLRAERAGLTFTVKDKPLRTDIEAIAPRSLTVAMEGHGDTNVTRTWTSSGWPPWLELPSTYQFSDGRELEEEEEFALDAVSALDWKKEFNQVWNRRDTLITNVLRREEFAEFNAASWVSGCVDLNLETLWAIGRAENAAEIDALVAETDYEGRVSLLRDTAYWLAGREGCYWRKAFRPVLDVAEWRG